MAKKKKATKGTQPNNHQQAIEIGYKEIEQKYGLGSIMPMDQKPMKVDFIPTHSLYLNKAMGIGGFPTGRIVEILGQESTGKTTLATSVMINALHKFPDKRVLFIDVEHAYDSQYAVDMGLDLHRVDISQPDSAEQTLNIAERMMLTNGYSVLVIDSTAAMVPEEELGIEYGDSKSFGGQARLMSEALRKLSTQAYETNTLVIFISQMRADPRPMANPWKATGGNALKFYASVRVDMRNMGKMKTGENDFHASRIKVTCIKNKVAPPYRFCELQIYYGLGIMREVEVLEQAIEYGIVEKGGSWFTMPDETRFQGEKKVIAYLIENQDIVDDLMEKVRDAARAEAEPEPEPEPETKPGPVQDAQEVSS